MTHARHPDLHPRLTDLVIARTIKSDPLGYWGQAASGAWVHLGFLPSSVETLLSTKPTPFDWE